jgi:heat shock protein HslJ
MSKQRFWSNAALCAALLVCGPAALAQHSSALDGGWLLQSIDTLDARALNADMTLNGGVLSGSDGCNRISMGYSASSRDQHIRFAADRAAATLMACHGLADAVSRAFPAALSDVGSYRIVGERLELIGSDGQIRVVYGRQPVNIIGPDWLPLGLNINDGVESSARVDRVRLGFGKDGRAQVVTGCKTLFVPYRYSADGTMSFGMASLGRQARCAQKGDSGVVHRAMLRALSRVSKWERTGDRLELRSADGALQYHARELRRAR